MLGRSSVGWLRWSSALFCLLLVSAGPDDAVREHVFTTPINNSDVGSSFEFVFTPAARPIAGTLQMVWESPQDESSPHALLFSATAYAPDGSVDMRVPAFTQIMEKLSGEFRAVQCGLEPFRTAEPRFELL